MSESAIEPSAVYPPSRPIATNGRDSFYETYNTRSISSGDNVVPGEGRVTNIFVRLPGGADRSQTPNGVPKFLGSRSLIMFAWAAAMIMVSLDEWHTYHILPRPARLWDTSLTFLLIAGVSTFDPLVPICSIFAIGLVIVLGYQYYQGTGQFGSFGTTESAPGAAT